MYKKKKKDLDGTFLKKINERLKRYNTNNEMRDDNPNARQNRLLVTSYKTRGKASCNNKKSTNPECEL